MGSLQFRNVGGNTGKRWGQKEQRMEDKVLHILALTRNASKRTLIDVSFIQYTTMKTACPLPCSLLAAFPRAPTKLGQCQNSPTNPTEAGDGRASHRNPKKGWVWRKAELRSEF